MKPFFVYILKCVDGSYYTGHSDDLDKRLDEHYKGALKGYTSKKKPFELVFNECFGSREEAFNAEFEIKKWSRKKKEALIARDWDLISQLSKKKFS